MEKVGLQETVKFFSVDFNSIDSNDIFDINRYLMKRTWHKTMFGLIKKLFIRLLTIIVSASNHTRYMSLSNQKFMTQTAIIILHPNEHSQEFHY